MILKGIGATTHVDRHNCRISKGALESAAKDINEGTYAVGVGIEHDSTIMPIGKVINGKMIRLEDGEYALEIEQELFQEYQIYIDESDVKWYISESSIDTRPFADTQAENVEKIKILVDPVNFSQLDFESLMDFYRKECLLDTECFIRKSVIPDPEIVFTLMTGTIAVMAGKKIAEKITEQIADDIAKIYELIKKVVIETVKRCKQGHRPGTYVFKENNSYLMELAVVTEKTEILFEALSIDRICQVEIEVEKFINNFNVDIAKLQCIYDIEKQNWTINYVSTKDGKVIGSEKCYRKTVELAKRVEKKSSVNVTSNTDIQA